VPNPFELLPQGIPLAELEDVVKDPAALEARVGKAVLVLSPVGMQKPRLMQKTRTHDLVPNGTRDAAYFVVPLRGGGLFKVGRAASNDVVINDVTLSKLHAFIRETASGFAVEDGGSKNGTFVDDVPVPARGDGKAITLRSPTPLRFGSIALRFMHTADLRAFLEDEQRRRTTAAPA